MLTDMLAGATVYIVTGYTDMRKGIDGLSIIVEGKLGQDVYSKSVYLFCGRSCSKIKMKLSIILDTFNSNKFQAAMLRLS